MLHQWIRRAGGAVALAALAGCSADPMATGIPDDELATTLESMTQEANQRGDVDASAAFGGAAMALRLGIRPTPIAVKVGETTERYDAFVHVVSHARANAAPLRLRTLVAVQGDDRPRKVLYLATLADSAELGHPTMTLDRRPDVLQLAWASWRDLSTDRIWVGVSGKAGIVVESTGGDCPKVSARSDVRCTVGTFGVVLDGVFHALVRGQRGQVDRSARLDIATRGSGVNGAVLVF